MNATTIYTARGVRLFGFGRYADDGMIRGYFNQIGQRVNIISVTTTKPTVRVIRLANGQSYTAREQ